MEPDWSREETTKYQDHVIAHVTGATILGHFPYGDAINLLLDIGLIWTIYLDGDMALLPAGVMIADLELDDARKAELLSEALALRDEGPHGRSFSQITPAPVHCSIAEVGVYSRDERWRILLDGEDASLCIDASPSEGRIAVVIPQTWNPAILAG